MVAPATPADTGPTNFEFAVVRQFSEARYIAEVMLMEHQEVNGLGVGKEKPGWPPVLTADSIVRHMVVRSDVSPTDEQEREDVERIAKQLGTWCSQGDFEIIPIPKSSQVGYRITKKGIQVALEAIQARRDALSPVVNKAKSRRSKLD